MNDNNDGNEPTNLQEYRALRDQDPGQWGPREVLQHLLRHIEKGELDPDHVIVVFGNTGGEESVTGFLQGGTMNVFEQLGMLHITSIDITQKT